MGPWLLLLILALIAFVLGFVVAAKWLFIIAVVLLVSRPVLGVLGSSQHVVTARADAGDDRGRRIVLTPSGRPSTYRVVERCRPNASLA